MRTKSGHPVLRACFVNDVTVPEAKAYHATLIPGAKYDGWGHLVVGNITGVSGDVKKLLAAQKPDPLNPPPIAVVLESALARMAASLATRISENPNTDYFKTEDEAMEWLEQRMGVFMRKWNEKHPRR